MAVPLRTASQSADGEATVVSWNPADGSVIDTFPVLDRGQVTDLVDQARQAQQWWGALSFDERGLHLRRWRRQIWQSVTQIADVIHRENGKPFEDAVVEVALTVEHMRWAEKNARRALRSRRVAPGVLLANFSATVDREPLGVVGVIAPWNYPLYAPNSAAVFALAAGNTVVLKPSEYTPAVARHYVDAFREANPDAPPGCISVATGFGETGRALCTAGVDKISFTGSTRTGKAVMAACADTLTPVVLECGGKDAAIVAADADVEEAARAIAWGGYTNAGQTCVGVERVYVDATVFSRFTAALVAQIEAFREGTAEMGPMTVPGQREVVERHVRGALASGGVAVVGGEQSIGDRYIGPILLRDVPEASAAVQEETFGPTLTLRAFDTVDEAVSLANAVPYGLSAAVFSRAHAESIAGRLEVGQVCLNSVIAFAGMGSVPMGGTKGSGFGRLHGEDGLREFSRPRATVCKRFSIPGFELMRLDRPRYLLLAMRVLLTLRHRL